MGSSIRLLPRILIDQIAAGQVVASPAAIVKELLENAIDAKATQCTVETVDLEKISIRDNGAGIPAAEIKESILKHATSKIRAYTDLSKLHTFGFRGEALAAIASISHLTISSIARAASAGANANANAEKRGVGGSASTTSANASAGASANAENHGMQLQARGGIIQKLQPIAWTRGTTVTVDDIFFNTPARKKNLRAKNYENKRIEQEIVKVALAYPEVALHYKRNGKTVFDLAASETLPQRLARLMGTSLQEQLLEVNFTQEGQFKCYGFVGNRNCYRANRNMQFEFINQRCVEILHFSFLVKRAYDVLLPTGCFPVYFLFLEMNPEFVDVNIHPQKKEVRLSNQISFDDLFHALKNQIHPRKVFSLLHDRKKSLSSGLKLGSASRPESGAASESEASGAASTAAGDLSQNLAQSVPQNNPQNLLLKPIHQIISPVESDAPIQFPLTQPPNISAEHSEHAATTAAVANGDAKAAAASQAFPLHKKKTPFLAGTVQRSFGIIYGTYILTEIAGIFTLIDQHAAHERINYEKFQKLLLAKDNSLHIQPLLKSIEIHATPEEISQIQKSQEKLRAFGYDVDVWQNSIALRSTPVYVYSGQEVPQAGEMLSYLLRACEMENAQQLFESFIAMRACKSSIRKNDPLSDQMIPQLIEQLFACDDPTICPHGRPTMMQMDQRALDKLFDRLK